jgi:hypothetical protein
MARNWPIRAGESPRIWWMHVGAQGDPAELARAVRAALEQTGTPLPVELARGLRAALDQISTGND